jgi:hypothetical protein
LGPGAEREQRRREPGNGSRWEHVRYDDGEHVRDRETGWWIVIRSTPGVWGGLRPWEVDVWSEHAIEGLSSALDRVNNKELSGSADYDHYVGGAHGYERRPRRGEIAELVDSLRKKLA